MTNSQKVRYLIKLLWVAENSNLTEEEYYNEKMVKYIEFLKEKLKQAEDNFLKEQEEISKDVS